MIFSAKQRNRYNLTKLFLEWVINTNIINSIAEVKIF